MSLRVWLPLTKDLRNQGLSNYVPTVQSGTTATYVNGKMGKALNTGGVVMPASITKQVLNNDEFTYACWLYVNGAEDSTTERAMIFGNNNGRQFSMFQYPTANDFHYSWASYENGTWSSNWGGVITDALPSYKWTHITVVYNNNITDKVKIYINGEVVLTNGGFTSNSTSFEFDTQLIHNSPYHYLNDVRLYDHALSPMEVKELSKGLVLHFPLSNNGVGGENLLGNTYDFSNIYNTNTGTQTIITDSNDGIYLKSHPSSVDWSNIVFKPFFLASNISGKTITVSCDIRAYDLPSTNTSNYVYLTLQAYDTSTTNTRAGNRDYSIPSNFLKEGEWVRISYQRVVNFDDWAVGSGYTTNNFNYISLALFNHSGKRIDFRKAKVEIGDHPTPWCPNSSDTLYTTLGYNDNIEYDTSGFGNNGMRVSDFSWTSDTPKYQVSTKFSDGSYIKYKGPEFMYQATYAFWVKSASYTGYNMIHGSLGSPGAGTSPWLSANTESSGAWEFFGNNSPNYTKASGTISTNAWHHLVYVWNNGVAQWYVDGVPSGNAVTYTTRTFIQNTAESSIGDSYTGTSWNGTPFTGQLSDFRIYATALSADDVLSLYQNSAYIDSSGNVYGAVHTEV